MKALLFVLPTLYLPGVLAVTCYRPNGISSTNGDSKSCHSINGAASMCCNEYDECLENGLCKVAADTGVEGSNVTYWRDTCSVSNWPEVGCLRVCASGDLAGENARITPCDGTDTSETWCCGTTAECCGTGEEVHVPWNIYTTSTATLTSTTSTSSSTSTDTSATSASTATPTFDSDSEGDSSSGISTGAKAGVGVGVAVGAIAIIAGAVYFLIARRRNKAAAAAAGTPAGVQYSVVQPVMQEPQELGWGQGRPHEKPAGVQDSRFELP